MLYGDTLTLIKQKITNIVVFESICSRPKGVLSEWGFVQWGYVRLPFELAQYLSWFDGRLMSRRY